MNFDGVENPIADKNTYSLSAFHVIYFLLGWMQLSVINVNVMARSRPAKRKEDVLFMEKLRIKTVDNNCDALCVMVQIGLVLTEDCFSPF